MHTLFTCVYLCSPVHTCVHLCILVHTYVYLYSPVYTCVHLCIPVFTCAHLCSPMFTCEHLCIPVFTYAHLCIPVFTCVHLCTSTYTCLAKTICSESGVCDVSHLGTPASRSHRNSNGGKSSYDITSGDQSLQHPQAGQLHELGVPGGLSEC